jgi:hypothetical protein
VLIVAARRYPQIVGVLQRKPTPRSKVCNTAGDVGDARIVIRGLLAVAPAALLVACGVPAAQRPYAEVPSRTAAAVATEVAVSPTPAVEEVRPAAVGKRAPRSVAPRAPRPATAATEGCNRNYTPCVPDDPVDVDCAGGAGNGPSYVTGPVRVIGKDVYGLDADHNGIGCEAGAAASSASALQQPLPAPAPEGPAAPPTSRPRPRPTEDPPPTRPTTTLTPTNEASRSPASTSELSAAP